MNKNLGAQLYTVREYCQNEKDFARSMKKIRDIGYKAVQISGIGPIDAKTIKRITDSNGLEIYCTHRPFDEYKNNIASVVDYHHTLGTKIAGLGMMPKEYLKNLDSIKEFLKIFNYVSKELKKEDLYFGYHNHAIEFVKIDGKFVFDYLIENTDPDCFKFIADTYWFAASGLDPAEMIEKLGKRAIAVHFKDLKSTIENKADICEVIEGNLNWDKIIDSCEKAGSEYILVEQDRCEADPFDSLKISYDNLTKKGFC